MVSREQVSIKVYHKPSRWWRSLSVKVIGVIGFLIIGIVPAGSIMGISIFPKTTLDLVISDGIYSKCHTNIPDCKRFIVTERVKPSFFFSASKLKGEKLTLQLLDLFEKNRVVEVFEYGINSTYKWEVTNSLSVTPKWLNYWHKEKINGVYKLRVSDKKTTHYVYVSHPFEIVWKNR